MELVFNMKSKLTDLQIIAIEEASHGCISDPLHEWPFLIAAFSNLGLPCQMMRIQAIKLCKLIVTHPNWK